MGELSAGGGRGRGERDRVLLLDPLDLLDFCWKLLVLGTPMNTRGLWASTSYPRLPATWLGIWKTEKMCATSSDFMNDWTLSGLGRVRI